MTATDLSDEWTKGYLRGLAETANGTKPIDLRTVGRYRNVATETAQSSWAPIDLTDALAGHDVERPAMLCRTDGVALLYAARTHQFAGESESCKTWCALLVAAQTLNTATGRVLWIDFEDDQHGIVAGCDRLASTRKRSEPGSCSCNPKNHWSPTTVAPQLAASTSGRYSPSRSTWRSSTVSPNQWATKDLT